MSTPASPNSTASLQAVASSHPAEAGMLAFHISANRAWVQARWRWRDAASGGTDLTPGYEALRVRLRVTGSTQAEGLTLALGSGGLSVDGRRTTASIRVRSFAPDFADGAWHNVVIPLALLTSVPNGFDATHADALVLALWAEQEDCTVEIADITFMTLPPPAAAAPPVAAAKDPKEKTPTPVSKEPPTPPGFAEQWKHAEVLKTQIAEGMNRSLIENAFLPPRDGGLQSSKATRYYMGNEVMIEVTYDETGGPFSGDNRVKGTIRIYRSAMHSD